MKRGMSTRSTSFKGGNFPVVSQAEIKAPKKKTTNKSGRKQAATKTFHFIALSLKIIQLFHGLKSWSSQHPKIPEKIKCVACLADAFLGRRECPGPCSTLQSTVRNLAQLPG
jgi:hypothetical protein